MKALNNMTFIYNATTEVNAAIADIEKAETYEKAKKRANYATGFVDCLIVYLNTMICKENNDFTGELGETLDVIMSRIFQAVAEKAIATGQDDEEVAKALEMRDKYRD